MKKTFALVLAVAMVMSLAAVSFAANLPGHDLEVVLDTAYKYENDDKAMSAAVLSYGDTVYFPLVDENDAPITDYEAVEKLKIKAKWEMGGDLVESVSISKKSDGGAYKYYIAVKVASKQTTADADIVGTLTLNRKAVTVKATAPATGTDTKYSQIKDKDVNISFNVFYGKTWMTDAVNYKVGDDGVTLKWDTNYALKFEADDEVEIEFGTEPNEGTFTVDVSGQGKLFVRYNTTADDAIANANPGAKLKFINFNNVKFNRTGEFMYEYEDGAYAYQIVDGKLVAIPGCEYDDADEAFYFYTRTLGSYVFSDVELVNPTVDAPVVTAPVETNPSTGAAA